MVNPPSEEANEEIRGKYTIEQGIKINNVWQMVVRMYEKKSKNECGHDNVQEMMMTLREMATLCRKTVGDLQEMIYWPPEQLCKELMSILLCSCWSLFVINVQGMVPVGVHVQEMEVGNARFVVAQIHCKLRCIPMCFVCLCWVYLAQI